MPSMKCFCRAAIVVIVVLGGAAGLARAEEPAAFTVVLLPDTQLYSKSFPENYVAQTQWIKDRAAAENIKFVIHLGDIIHDCDAEEQWQNADRAHRVLDGAVPYSMLPGNHDMINRDTAIYNKHFPPSRFKDCPWYGGHEGETNDNNYCLFEAAGMKFLVVSLEYAPSDATLEWAGGIVDAHPDRRVLVATHCYLGGNQRRDCGKKIWEKLVRQHENIFMVHSGHVLGVGLHTGTNDAGGTVYEMLTDYQGLPHGGDGWLRTLRFVPGENKIRVTAYSPVLDKTNKDPRHSYTLDYPMTAAPLKKAG